MIAASDVERRRFTRVPFETESTLWIGPQAWSVQQADVSLAGALVEMPTDEPLEAGARCQLQLRLGACVCITMNAVIAFVRGRRVGLRSIGIDVDSLTHLRRLLEVNVADEMVLAHDLAELNLAR